MNQPPGWQLVAIGAGAAMFLGMALGRFSYSAMIPALVEAGGLDAVTAGYVGGANLAGFLAGAAVSTIAARRFGLDRVLVASILLAVLALAASAVPIATAWLGAWLGGWRAAAGLATGCIMVLGLAVTAQSAPPERRTEAMSYIFVGVGSGILFGGTAVPAALTHGLLAAWLVVAAAGLAAGGIALYAWRDLGRLLASLPVATPAGSKRRRTEWYAVIVASLLFSIGIVPHTIYWFDYLARDLALGYQVAGWHWAGVGVAAILGPIAASRLARQAGTALATALTFAILAAGVGLPWFDRGTAALVASTIIFGAQPAVSTLLGARARDLGTPEEMPAMMRAIILANGIGSGAAGVAVPALLGASRSYEVLFLIGGLAFALGTLLCLPALLRRP